MPAGVGLSGTGKVVFTKAKGSFAVAADGRAATVIVADGDADVVRAAAEMFCGDVENVSGARPELSVATTLPDGAPHVLAGTLGRSPLLTASQALGK